MAYRILLGALFVAGLATGRRLPNIYWNTSSDTFDIATTNHVKVVEIGDQVSIVCPEPGPDYQFTQLYMVNKTEYDHCEIIEEKPKLIGACKDNDRQSSLSIVFRKYSPIPGGLEFTPGHTYYVISTSTGTKEGLENRRDGLCKKHMMKIKFEVQPDHHHKWSRHEDRSVSPKFAARTIDRSSDSVLPSDFSTEGARVEYIIHEGNEEQGDDDASSSLSLLPTVLLTIVYLLRQ
ncbi:hypothetical protein PMAYCL1PPCAC_18843 [Pristionchus mayeri]|uniref:Ephrin RBD domain-containing protein n=1 Tax=Pristionchus mayeri TaxID=1317129 RepID=A0AAN5CQ87_9BILA|nr:hypothetical protein PMAYCL1PPCAC_18843 [Pristionchus mayeri]